MLRWRTRICSLKLWSSQLQFAGSLVGSIVGMVDLLNWCRYSDCGCIYSYRIAQQTHRLILVLPYHKHDEVVLDMPVVFLGISCKVDRVVKALPSYCLDAIFDVIDRVTWSTVDLPHRKPACSFGSCGLYRRFNAAVDHSRQNIEWDAYHRDGFVAFGVVCRSVGLLQGYKDQTKWNHFVISTVKKTSCTWTFQASYCWQCRSKQ